MCKFVNWFLNNKYIADWKIPVLRSSPELPSLLWRPVGSPSFCTWSRVGWFCVIRLVWLISNTCLVKLRQWSLITARPKPHSWTPVFSAVLKCRCFFWKMPTLEESDCAVTRPQSPGSCQSQAWHQELTLCPSSEQTVIQLGTKPLPWRCPLSRNLPCVWSLRAGFPSQSFSQEDVRLLLEGFVVWDDVKKTAFRLRPKKRLIHCSSCCSTPSTQINWETVEGFAEVMVLGALGQGRWLRT